VAIPAGRDRVVVRCFGTFTAACMLWRIWGGVGKCGITTIAMESDGRVLDAAFELARKAVVSKSSWCNPPS